MAQTVGIFHGYGGFRANSWQSWLNQKLISQDVNTIYPSFPFLGSSTIEDWYAQFQKSKDQVKEPISLVGHSAGTTFSFYVVQKTNITFERLVLVCPLNDIEGAKISGLLDRPGKEVEAPFIEKFVHQHFDYDLIKSRVKEFVFFLSDNDPNVPYQATKEYFQNIFPDSQFITLENYGHVNEKAGILELPQVFDVLT